LDRPPETCTTVVDDKIGLSNHMTLNTMARNISVLQDTYDDNRELLFSIKNDLDSRLTKDEMSDLEFIEEARERFASIRNWTPEYDCDGFTNDFTDLMAYGFGIDLFGIHAFNDDEYYGHSYNCIPYDAQSGLSHTDWDRFTFVRRESVLQE
jgi:hypothetical protein